MQKWLGKQDGFTLIEVVAVLVILGILAVVVANRATSTSTYSVRSQAAALKSHIRYAQTRAMATESIWGITISAKQYALFRDDDTTKTVMLPGAESNPVVLKANEPSLSSGAIRFDGKGRPVDTGGAPISGDTTFTVSMAGETETITITQNTGFIP